MCNCIGEVIGLICWVGWVVFGIIVMICELVEMGRLILMFGCFGVGKIMVLWEIVRVFVDELEKWVVIIDIFNEIVGDGDVFYFVIGWVCWM